MEKVKEIMQEEQLHTWCLEQTAHRYMGILDQEKIDRLDAIGFPWKHYEKCLDELGFHWEKNKPQ